MAACVKVSAPGRVQWLGRALRSYQVGSTTDAKSDSGAVMSRPAGAMDARSVGIMHRCLTDCTDNSSATERAPRSISVERGLAPMAE